MPVYKCLAILMLQLALSQVECYGSHMVATNAVNNFWSPQAQLWEFF